MRDMAVVFTDPSSPPAVSAGGPAGEGIRNAKPFARTASYRDDRCHAASPKSPTIVAGHIDFITEQGNAGLNEILSEPLELAGAAASLAILSALSAPWKCMPTFTPHCSCCVG